MRDHPPSSVHAVVVDPRRLVREGVCALLAEDDRLSVSASDGVGASAVGPRDGDVPVVFVLGEGVPGPPGLAAVRIGELDDVHGIASAVIAAAAVPASRTASGRADLTPRERAVLRGVVDGRSAAGIGHELGISPRTVERHKRSLTVKLGAPNLTRAVALSHEQGLLRHVG